MYSFVWLNWFVFLFILFIWFIFIFDLPFIQILLIKKKYILGSLAIKRKRVYQKEKESLFNGGHVADELSRWKDFKVITVFSVPQLGNIIKLLLDSGLYLNKNKTELLDFFSYFFTTVKQDNVSSGSLRSNFYKDNATVSKAVREILMDLVNYSHKTLNIIAYCAFTYLISQF